MMTDLTQTPLFLFLRSRIAQRTRSAEDSLTADMSLSDIGLQSIDAVLVCGEVEDEFGIEIDPAEIFDHATVKDFCQALTARLPV